ncbi:hypothetical protein Pd630_LPD16004 (plasmid) [Rhodococcus opacus PD630]|nr:hypothetical protein Pd630_LPD16004 [Rhodococcus opacus PD630]
MSNRRCCSARRPEVNESSRPGRQSQIRRRLTLVISAITDEAES